MRLDLTKCDACPCSVAADEANAQSWLKFYSVFGDMDGNKADPVFTADLCPACVERVIARLRTALNPAGRTGDARLESIETVEMEHIQNVLNAVQWVKTRAATILGIERSTLDRKIKQYRLCPPSPTKTAGTVPELATAP